MRRFEILLIFAVVILLSSCSKKEWKPDTSWHHEPIDDKSVSFTGSYQNAIDTLKVESNSWKLIGLRANDECEWGFKVVISFPDHPDYAPDNFGGNPFMPISQIKYDLFDQDGFYLATLSLVGESLGVVEGESQIFQRTGLLPVIDAQKASSGKLTVRAGYIPKPPYSAAPSGR